MTKNIILVLALLITFGLGAWLTHRFYTKQEVSVEEESQVLLERIETVAKLITVEGYFSEVYDYQDHYGYDVSFFRKKALLRVKAKVSVGYDFAALKIESLPQEKTIIISNLPDPEILSIDHDIDYYDIQEGIFNSFSAQDYTKLNADAKEFIKGKVKESDLFLAAEEQGNGMQEMLQFIVESAGWTLDTKTRWEQEKIDTLVN